MQAKKFNVFIFGFGIDSVLDSVGTEWLQCCWSPTPYQAFDGFANTCVFRE